MYTLFYLFKICIQKCLLTFLVALSPIPIFETIIRNNYTNQIKKNVYSIKILFDSKIVYADVRWKIIGNFKIRCKFLNLKINEVFKITFGYFIYFRRK